MTSLSALIDRLAQATETDDFHSVLYDVLKVLTANQLIPDDMFERAWAFRNAGAYLESTLSLAKDAEQRRRFLYHAADTCFFAKLDPAQHAPRLICFASLRAIESGRTE